MKSEIFTYKYENNEIQNVQMVTLDSFDELNILKPIYNKEAYFRLCKLYDTYITKKFGFILGKIILFTLDVDEEIPFEFYDEQYGQIYDPYVATKIAFTKNIRIKNNKLYFLDSKVKEFYEKLEKKNNVFFTSGKRNYLSILPVSRNLGFLSENKKECKLRVNSSFFTMDMLDANTVYDKIGLPFGLNIKNGNIYYPPLFDREALLVDENNKINIRNVSIKEVKVLIDNKQYINKENALFFDRLDGYKTPKKGNDIVIVDNKIVAYKKGGNTKIPSSGFIVKVKEDIEIIDKEVKYRGFENIRFGLQVGNSVVVNNELTDFFKSKFYNYLNILFKPSFPPSMYPLDFDKDKAPRIVLGEKDNKPVILWFEGQGKFIKEGSKESVGASLKEVKEIVKDLGIRNGINLDGGGSALILIDNQKLLKVSDRDEKSFEEIERAIGLGLYVE